MNEYKTDLYRHQVDIPEKIRKFTNRGSNLVVKVLACHARNRGFNSRLSRIYLFYSFIVI